MRTAVASGTGTSITTAWRRAARLFAIAAAAAALASAPAMAQEQAVKPAPTPEVREAQDHARSLSAAFKFAARTISPSVVNIRQVVEQQVFQGFWEPPATRNVVRGVGSGVIVSADGYILTNYHVIAGAREVIVRLQDGREPRGRIIGSDPSTDLGVVKIDAGNLTPAQWGDADALEVGEWVLAVGSPFGEYENTVTAGIVSAKNRRGLRALAAENYQDFIQTDAAINPGNSGGPLVDLDGRIVGINSQIATRTGGSIGIGFAIPSTIARPVTESIIANGRARRGWLGVAMQQPGEGEQRGVRIGSVIRGGPAERAGLREGDLVTAFNGRPVDSVERLRNSIAFTPPGSSVQLEVSRDGQARTVSTQVLDRTEGLSLTEGHRAYARFGFGIANFTDDIANRLGYRRGFEGVVVVNVDPMSPAGEGESALQVGDVIVQVNRSPTPDAQTFDRIVEDVVRDTIRLHVIRAGQRWIVEIPARDEPRE